MKFLTPINLNKNELQNAVIQNLASAPASPVEGLTYFDTVLHQFGVYQNGAWVYLSSLPANIVTKATNASIAGVAQVSGGADKTLVDYAGGVGMVKSTVAGVLSAATAGTDYTLGTSALSTGILKNTTGTGAHTIAIAADFPTLNQNTSGTASNITGVLNSTSHPALTGDVTASSGTTVTTIAANAVTIAKMQQITTNSLLGRSTASTGNVEVLSVGSGLSLLAGTLSATGSGGTVTAVSIASANGFAGSSTGGATPALTISTSIIGLLKGNGTAVSAAVAGTDYSTPSSTDTFTNKTINASNNTISNLTTAMFAANVIDTDVTLAAASSTRIPSQSAVKAYVDANIQGVIWKIPVRAASTTNGTLASAYANGSTVDGVTLATNDRILLKDQATASENGIYVVNATGAPTRSADANTDTEIKGLVVDVLLGTVNANTAWINTNTSTITLGSTAITFIDFIKANVPTATTSIQGKVYLATQAEAEAKLDTSKAVVSADLLNFPIKKIFTIGDGSTTAIVVTHNLGTQDITVSVRDASTNAMVFTDVTATSTNTATITFAVAPATNAYKVVVIG